MTARTRVISWLLVVMALPASCASSYGALRIQQRCLDEGIPIAGCERAGENPLWLLAGLFIIAFAWALDGLLKGRDPDDQD